MPEVAIEAPDQIENLGLNRDVESGGRLVGDQQVGPGSQRHGDHHSLGHSARKLVGIGPGPAPRVGDADFLQHCDHPVLDLLVREIEMDLHRLADLLPGPVDRVEDDCGC